MFPLAALSIFQFIKSNFKYIVILFVVLLGVYLYWQYGHKLATIATLRQQLTQVVEINKENDKAIIDLKQQMEQTNKLIAELMKKDKELQKFADSLKEKIVNAPTTNNGPAAPVITDTLNSLRAHNSDSK